MLAPTFVIPDELAAILDVIDPRRIVFTDASALADDPDDQHPGVPAVTSLAAMGDSHRAEGNCRPATDALNAHLAALGHATAVAQAFFDAGVSKPGHVATAIALPGNGSWVIDFTARQFDPTAPVPLVLPALTWMACLADWAEAQGWRLRAHGGA